MSDKSKSPVEKLRTVYKTTFVVGILYLTLGGFFVFVALSIKKVPDNPNMAALAFIFGIISLLAGILFIILGIFIRRRSSIALGIAIAFMVTNILFAIFNQNFIGLLIPTIFICYAWGGFGAIKELKAEKNI
jgi:hypothetical protein